MRIRTDVTLLIAFFISLFVVSACTSDDDADDRRNGGIPDVSMDAGDTGGIEDTGDPDGATEDAATPDADLLDGDISPEPDSDQDADGGPDPSSIDRDNDGLTDAEEASLCNGQGSNPRDDDTDGDSLTDFEEVQQGTSPCSADTDGDGATDWEELQWGLSPTNPVTYQDGIVDGERWILNACDNATPNEISVFSSGFGNWKIGLPTTFSNYVNLGISGASQGVAAGVYDNATLEVAGFILSRDAPSTGVSSPEIALTNDIVPRLSNVVAIDDPRNGSNFEIHSGYQAATGEYAVSAPAGEISVRKLRELILPQLGPFAFDDLSGLPNSSGALHSSFKVIVTVIQRPAVSGPDNHLLLVGIAPLSEYESDDKVEFRMDDLTNPTNVAEGIDTVQNQCLRDTADQERPTVEFYWVLDQTGSMTSEIDTVIAFSTDFELEVRNTSLDYRMGVTNMDPINKGRLVVPPGWHDQGSIFNAEVSDRAHPNLCDGSGGWGCDLADEDGLYNARLGLEHMLGAGPQSPTPPEEIRSDARVVTIIMTDDDANTVRDNEVSQSAYNSYFDGKTTMFSIVDPGTGSGNNRACNQSAAVGQAYREVSQVTGGKTASICGDLESTITDIIQTASGLSSNYPLNPRPITPSLEVRVNDTWVPRSSEDGFKYFAESGTIAFFGSFRPDPSKASSGVQAPDRISVTYSTFNDKCKETGRGSQNCQSP